MKIDSNQVFDFQLIKLKNWLLIWLVVSCCEGCYTFKGISIDPNDQTFFVNTFETLAANAPPNLGIEFTELLKDKIRTETRLTLRTDNADLEFSGKITDFRVEILAPRPGELASQNKLVVVYELELRNNKDETRGWTNRKSFSHFAEFPNDRDLLSVQENLLRDINTQILEDIFNAAFNNW